MLFPTCLRSLHFLLVTPLHIQISAIVFLASWLLWLYLIHWCWIIEIISKLISLLPLSSCSLQHILYPKARIFQKSVSNHAIYLLLSICFLLVAIRRAPQFLTEMPRGPSPVYLASFMSGFLHLLLWFRSLSMWSKYQHIFFIATGYKTMFICPLFSTHLSHTLWKLNIHCWPDPST